MQAPPEKSVRGAYVYVMTTNDKIPATPELVSLKHAATRLDLSLRGVYRLIARGHLPIPLKVGGSRKFFEKDIQTYFGTLEAQRAGRAIRVSSAGNV